MYTLSNRSNELPKLTHGNLKEVISAKLRLEKCTSEQVCYARLNREPGYDYAEFILQSVTKHLLGSLSKTYLGQGL